MLINQNIFFHNSIKHQNMDLKITYKTCIILKDKDESFFLIIIFIEVSPEKQVL